MFWSPKAVSRCGVRRDDQTVMLLARSDLVSALVVDYGRLSIVKDGSTEGEMYVQKALTFATDLSRMKRNVRIADKSSLHAHVRAKDAAGEFW